MSGNGNALRPARIPADRRPARDAVIDSPWYGPSRLKPADPKLSGRPWILTFVGTDESFVDVFFRGLQASGSQFTAGAFPKILPVRDYAEPPRALIDGSGAPVYERAYVEPADGEWPGGDEAELDESASFAEVLRDAVRSTDPDPLPPASDASRASWLRKLYLPMHVHFHVVACDIVCARPGAPRIDPKRVIEAGMVVRRFVPERDGTQAHWEDWIPSPFGNGIWADIADEEMKPPGQTRPLDPKEIVLADEVAVRHRLGLEQNPTAKLSLATIPLAAVPVGMGEGNKHTARWGFLPVSSPDKQRELPDPDGDEGVIKTALAARAEAHLEERIVERHAEIRARIRGTLLPLVEMFREALPGRPTTAELNSAYAGIDNAVPFPLPKPSQTQIDDMVKTTAIVALSRYADAVLVPQAGGWVPQDKQTNWATAIALAQANGPSPILLPWFLNGDGTTRDVTATVMLEMAYRAVDDALAADSLTYGVDERLLVALVLLVRRYRAYLLSKFYGSAFTGPTKPDPDKAPAPEMGPGKQVPMSAGSLGAELDGWLAVNKGRDKEPVAWPEVTFSGAELDYLETHTRAVRLENVLEDIDAQGAGAGGGYASVINDRTRTNATDLRTQLGPPELRERGIDMFAQPERGLLVFPGPAPTEGTLDALKTEVSDHYKNGTKAMVKSEAKALRQVVRPRYDAESLYAVWCYARVAGKDACEEPQIAWSRRTEVFSLAEPMDLLGLKPVAMRLPDLPKMLRDIPRMKKARALPFAAVTTPQDSGVKTGEDPKDTAREWGIAWICSFGIPVFTICAWVMFSIIFSILLLIPGFAWLLLLKFCIPLPTSKKA